MYTYTSITALASFVCYYNNLHPLPQVLLQKRTSFTFNCYIEKGLQIISSNFNIM